MYTIRFNHTSPATVRSIAAAKRHVRGRVASLRKIRYCNTPDGLFVYRSKADMAADPDGSRAFAVISKNTTQD